MRTFGLFEDFREWLKKFAQIDETFLRMCAAFITIPAKYFTAPWVDCASSPCSNGGTCVDVNVDTFVCMCRDGYFGTDCGESESCIHYIQMAQEISVYIYFLYFPKPSHSNRLTLYGRRR